MLFHYKRHIWNGSLLACYTGNDRVPDRRDDRRKEKIEILKLWRNGLEARVRGGDSNDLACRA